ncbi:hypothetical protein H5410_049474, partial [Solanum commersonii]
MTESFNAFVRYEIASALDTPIPPKVRERVAQNQEEGRKSYSTPVSSAWLENYVKDQSSTGREQWPVVDHTVVLPNKEMEKRR